MTQRTFYHYFQGWQQITLFPGQQKILETGRMEHEEGYSEKYEELKLGMDGVLRLYSVQSGRDCDGFISHTNEYYATEYADDKKAGGKVPVWIKDRGEVYDPQAQAMGY